MPLRDSGDMRNYAVSQKIRTVASLDSAMHVGGITLRPFPRKAGKSAQSWAAEILVAAHDVDQAVAAAWEQVIPLLDRMALVTQSAFSMAAQSYLARRLTDEPDGVFYMLSTRSRHPNGMPLWSADQLGDIDALADAPAVALRNFREAATAGTSQGALSSLIIAAEALAGSLPKVRKCQCGGEVACPSCGKAAVSPFPDQARLEAILGSTAYKGLYRGSAKGGPVRNKLVHGSPVPADQILDLLEEAYNRVLDYFRQTFGLKSVGPIQNAPRSFTRWEYFAHYARMKDGTQPDIVRLDDGWPTQTSVELVDPPANY